MMQDIYTLLCKRDIKMALITIPGILKFLNPEQKLFVIDDGSFDDETTRQVEEIYKQITVIRRVEREDFVLKELGNREACIKYRNDFPFSFKLIDIPLLAKSRSQRYTYTDTDIIYLKNSEAYFSRDVNTYLRTDAIKLSFKLQQGILKYKWKIPFKFNAGYLSYGTEHYDLDFIEYFLKLPDVRNVPWVSEQSCWALIFGRSGDSFCPLENEFVCRENFAGPESDTNAIHLIGNLKKNVAAWSLPQPFMNDVQSSPGFEKSKQVTIGDWVKKSAKRFIRL